MPIPTPAHAFQLLVSDATWRWIGGHTESCGVDIRTPGRFYAVVEVAHERLALKSPYKSFGDAETHNHGAENVYQAAEGPECMRHCGVRHVSGTGLRIMETSLVLTNLKQTVAHGDFDNRNYDVVGHPPETPLDSAVSYLLESCGS